MAPATTCGVCGTVNVLASGCCIACSQPLADGGAAAAAAAPAPADPGQASKTAPLEEGDYRAAAAQAAAQGHPVGPVPADASAPAAAVAAPSAPAAAPAAAQAAGDAAEQAVRDALPPAAARPAPSPPAGDAVRTDEIGGSSLRRTVVEPAARRLRPKSVARAQEGRDSRDELVPEPNEEQPAAPAEPRASSPEPSVRFVVRLLLPEGDKRLVEIGDRPVKVGSGLDEVGLAGDPRVRPSEATLEVVDGILWIDVAADSTGVYRRVEGEEQLNDGDVVLVGDIAATFQRLPASPALAPERHVLGGAANAACGRLVFLRRDGSPGPIHDLPQGKTILGRTDGHLNFPSDSRLSRRHARFFAYESQVTVEDLDSRNGTYVRIRGRRRLSVGDALRVGSAGLQIRMSG